MALALNPASVFSCVSLRATCTALCVCVCAHGRFCVSVYLPLMKRPYFVLGRGEAASARQQRSIERLIISAINGERILVHTKVHLIHPLQ